MACLSLDGNMPKVVFDDKTMVNFFYFYSVSKNIHSFSSFQSTLRRVVWLSVGR